MTPEEIASNLTNLEQEALIEMMAVAYIDYSHKPGSFETFRALEDKGLCRAVWQDSRSWRVYQSPEQIVLGRAVAAAIRDRGE